VLYIKNMTSINDLQNDPKNARKRTDRSAKLIKQSLEQYGAARSIVIDENNRILAGNGTIAGAKAAGIKNLKIIEADGDEIIAVKRSNLTEDQKVGLAIADNRTGDLSEWDIDMLEKLSEEHDLNDFFDKKELDDILSKKEVLPTEGLTDPDDIPEVPEEPITKEGDLYILGNHRLLCGDSTNIQHVEKLINNNNIDLLYTDPPYGINEKGDRSKRGGLTQGNKFKDFKDDTVQYAIDAYNICESVLKIQRQVWWGANYYCHSLPQSNNWFVWDKRVEDKQKDTQSDCELAWVKSKWSSIRIFRHLWKGMMKDSERGKKRVHPTQKPVALAEWSFNYFKNANTILDLFGGSGSTLIAAERLKKQSFLMELDAHYCDVIVKRWEDFTGNTAKRVSSS